VVLRHYGGYKTYYGHLSRYAKGIAVGTRVKQKQVIGYVGSTGLSTGPHVDYRIAENGAFKNPFSLRFKPKSVLGEGEIEEFDNAKVALSLLLSPAKAGTALQAEVITITDKDSLPLMY